METLQRFNPMRVNLEVKEPQKRVINPHSVANNYIVPLWIQEVSQVLREQYKKAAVERSSWLF